VHKTKAGQVGCTSVFRIRKYIFCVLTPKKIYRLKGDQAFSLSLELGRRKKVARHPWADFLLHFLEGGGDFVDTVIVVKMT
jgi:hypothetical protein